MVVKGFLSDPDGDKSSGRLMKLCSFFIATGLALYGAATKGDTSQYVYIFLGVAMSAELVQKVTGK
jgi:hypothetical protein